LINGEAAFLEKKRDLLSGAVTTEEKELTLEGRDIVIVDDIISTGGTLINAAKIVSRGNPSRIIAACIHGLYANNALEKLAAAGVSEVVSTDTIESPTSKISVARIIADTLKELTGG
ncbi:MAG: phosphoribosyltransferase family protein, partial [Candidatus Nezhaarchaeales archaeon]